MIKMVGRRFVVEHDGSNFDLDYDTEDGLEVLKFQLFSLTSLPPDQQKIVDVSGDRLVSEDAHLHSVSDVLRLLSLDGEDQGKNQATRIEDKPDDHHLQSDEEFARMLQAEEDALMMQRFVASENKEQIEQRIRPYVEQVLKYEDPVRQEAARNTVPMDKLEEKAFLMMAREGNFKPSKDEQNHAFLLQLLFWFKQSFRWVNSPHCDNCNNETANQGMGAATSSELQYGASRVELYRCKSCSNITRFPRYNDPLKLLETRKGRCGEWANCFTLYCRAFGYESRLILDFTDHVWTECFSQYLGRWMHLDPCEGIYDSPLLYEKGWNKNLNYVIGISKDGVHDVTKRYTKKWHEVLSRRNITTEPTLLSVLSNITRDLRKVLAPAMVLELEERDRIELESLERDPYLTDDPSIILPGRQSGSKEWRVSRSEFGSDDSLRSTSCPVRRCVDEHVTKIYNALSPILLQLVEEESFNKSKAVVVFESFKKILVDLKKSPFKTRKTSINSSSTDMTYLIIMLPAFAELLDALSLKSETGKNGIINICLASDPVKTSISLPVVFHALDDVIDNINQCNKLDKGSFSWPLLKLNRICSGLVLASGEELPLGIVTSAFDGTRLSKWEEPNGATGCWIIYKLPNNQMHELVAYEMMSANDAPERDPRDWIVEGSEDSGASWRILDRQNSQAFEKRFQRRTFIFESQGFLANAFRIQFLVVRDDKANSRFQIGSIDLYSKSSCVS